MTAEIPLRYGELRQIFKGDRQEGLPRINLHFLPLQKSWIRYLQIHTSKTGLMYVQPARSVFCSVAFRLSPGSPEARMMRFLWRKSYQGHGISILVLLLYNVRQALDAFLNDEEITMQLAIVFALVLIRYAFTISAAPPSLATKGNSLLLPCTANNDTIIFQNKTIGANPSLPCSTAIRHVYREIEGTALISSFAEVSSSTIPPGTTPS